MGRINADIHEWDVENNETWQATGQSVANRNLWISIPCLLLAFGVWQMWGMVTVQMKNLGFPFSQTELFTLTAVAGLTGATLRIPASFMIGIAGGRNTIFFTTALMIIPCLGAYFALQSKDTPLMVFILLAALSGIGGGNFANSMSNISNFFPRRQQGLALGLNAGLGNFGVTGMQILLPLLMTAAVFGPFSGAAMELQANSGTVLGRIESGTETWIQNPALFGAGTLAVMSIVAWFGMNNLRIVTPEPGNPIAAFGKIAGLYSIAFVTAGIGLYLFLPEPVGLGVLNMWIALPLIIVLTLGAMRLIPGPIQTNLKKQFAIFGNPHTWSMTLLYILTFGSFIGFSAALPLSIEVIFGSMMQETAAGGMERVSNPDGPSAMTWAWIGPFVGALTRPIGGWISDRVGGALVTQIITAVMVVSAVAAGYIMMLAYNSTDPNAYFLAFILTFVVFFFASGIGNGSTFRSIGFIFNIQQKGPVLGWTSAVAAYGAFIAPQVMGAQIKAGTPEVAMYGFAVFYALCLVVNWWFYLRRGAEIRNP